MKYILIPVTFFLIVFSAQAQLKINPEIMKLNNVYQAISGLYVDSVPDKKLVEAAIEATLKELDPHSAYIPKEEVEKVNEPLEGSFEGVGIQFQIFEDTILVVQIVAGTPADKVGIMPGDRIIYINEELMAGMKIKNSDVMKRLRGPKGTEVQVKILRKGFPDLLLFKIIRDKIPVNSVEASYMINNETGYVKVINFGSNTAEEFRNSLSKLKEAGMNKLILDLQGNGGGYLNAAIELADEFLGRDKLVVYTQGMRQAKSVAKASAMGAFEQGKVIVLVDEYSASASEILSGAIQDWDRGIIIGRRTFGKGLVQRQIPLSDGSMLRLTTARYYTPTGRCIQKSYKEGVDKYHEELANRYKHGEMLHADSIHFPDSLKYQTLVLKRTVYGGGGIMPDIFIPIDTTRFTDFHRKIVARGIMNKISVQFINENRDNLKARYPDFSSYQKNFNIPEDLFIRMRSMAEKEKIVIDEEQYKKSLPLISIQLKALFARDLWTVNEYYRVMDAENEPLQKAIQIFKSSGEYEKILKK
jgi:carboxyl-terminal processing protease